MLVHRARHNYPIPAGYRIYQAGIPFYTFFHFTAPAQITIDGTTTITKPNACILLPPHQRRNIVSPNTNLMNWLHLDAAVADSIKQYSIPENIIFYPQNVEFISPIFRDLEIETLADNIFREKLIHNRLEAFFINMSRSLYSNNLSIPINSQDFAKIYYVRGLFLSDMSKKWTISEMAAHASLSPSRFHAVYKAIFHTTPIRDLMEARIDHAKNLLLADDFVSIQDITDKLGYKSQYYFIHQFKAITGITPGVFRRKNR